MIYFIKCNEYLKVGFTSNLKSRLNDYVTENPYQLFLIHTLKGGIEVERKIHKQLKEWKHRGEWYHYTHDCQRAIGKILIENAENIEPSKTKNRRDKYRHNKTHDCLIEEAKGQATLKITKEIRIRICEIVGITQGTFRNHLKKLETQRKLARDGSLVNLKI